MDQNEHGSTPRPDPTILTTTQLLREVDALRTLVKGWVDSLQVLMESKLDGAVSVIGARLDGNDTALQAALQAAEKAVTKQNESFAVATKKSEDALFKQIDQLGVLISTANKGLEDKINDIRDRMTRFEGTVQGENSYSADARGNKSNIIAIIAILVGIVMGGFGFLFGHQSSPTPPPPGQQSSRP